MGQRLTTSLLFVVAAYHILKKDASKSAIFTAERIEYDFLLNSRSSNISDRKKMTLKTVATDNDILEKIFDGRELDKNEKANKLYKAYAKFRLFLEKQNIIDKHIDALKYFEIVEISLDKNDDNPQMIFENINSTGEPLSAGDKIRNWALMLNDEDIRSMVYNDYWREIERKLTRTEKDKQLDYISDFFRTYLMCKQNEFVSDEKTYPLFKTMLKTVEIENKEKTQNFYDDILKYLHPYLSIKFMETVPKLEPFSERIFSLKFMQTETINTFIINIFVDFIDDKLTKEEIENSLYLVETFLARRIICDFSAEGYNNFFSELHKSVKIKQKDNINKTYDDCLSALMLEKSGRSRTLPTDSEINNSIKTLNFYNKKPIINNLYWQKFATNQENLMFYATFLTSK